MMLNCFFFISDFDSASFFQCFVLIAFTFHFMNQHFKIYYRCLLFEYSNSVKLHFYESLFIANMIVIIPVIINPLALDLHVFSYKRRHRVLHVSYFIQLKYQKLQILLPELSLEEIFRFKQYLFLLQRQNQQLYNMIIFVIFVIFYSFLYYSF